MNGEGETHGFYSKTGGDESGADTTGMQQPEGCQNQHPACNEEKKSRYFHETGMGAADKEDAAVRSK